MNNAIKATVALLPGSYDPITTGHMDVIRRASALFDRVFVVISSSGRLIDLVDEVGADVIIKGVRNEADYAYEQKHALYNRAHNPKAETLYLPADPAYDHISSTLVRERIEAGQSIDDIVPAAVAEYVRRMGK